MGIFYLVVMFSAASVNPYSLKMRFLSLTVQKIISDDRQRDGCEFFCQNVFFNCINFFARLTVLMLFIDSF